ncbi:hypothetical protein Syun_012906 [Stephania yunnanensis]|uniref:Generative cell specific-1/HAP2 domain-containing protein n=1 Tax=Stephania yunnanensis TaxID=152371 RepID=A0AAP0K0F4_9MAGN
METNLDLHGPSIFLAFLFNLTILWSLALDPATAAQILSKSKLEKCEKVSESEALNCTKKIVVNIAVPSGASGEEASIVAEVVEVEENATQKMQTVRIPPVITVNKSAAYALYEITYIRDVPFKPEEYHVKTRKCEPDASADVVKICERLRDENQHVIPNTEVGVCLPHAGTSVVDKVTKGKANTAHCLRFPGDWTELHRFHVFGIGKRSLGFSVRIEVRTGSKVSEVVVSPENKTASSVDKFLKVGLIGDFVGYTTIPSLEDFYLVIPRQGDPGQPQNIGMNYSMWMLLERVRFTLDGMECNKIGVSYEAYNAQPDFCSSPLWSCLHNQLWNFWEADQNRIGRNQIPLYGVEGRFERINQHPDAGKHSFSIGVTEVLNTNILIELSADDIEYIYQRSPGKILSIAIPTFEALTQYGTATITTKNVGEVEASYSLTFDCSKGVSFMEEQFFIMKPNEVTTRSFKLYPTSDQAAKYECAAILKDSDFNEADRAECQFITTATVVDNGSITSFRPPKSGMHGFFESIEDTWKKLGHGFADFFTGRTCRSLSVLFRNHSFFMIVLLWLLHQKGLFDPLYEWWDERVNAENRLTHNLNYEVEGIGLNSYRHNHHKHEGRKRHRKDDGKYREGKRHHQVHKHNHLEAEYYRHERDKHHLHGVRKGQYKHHKNLVVQRGYSKRRGGIEIKDTRDVSY